MSAEFLLFVYGTLKRGQRSHHLLGGALAPRPATVLGRLLLHPDGYPVLEVPEELILAVAFEPSATPRPRLAPEGSRLCDASWRPIRGEIVQLRDPVRRIALLDDYEGCRRGRPMWYRRALVRASVGPAAAPTGRTQRVWTYVRGPAMLRDRLRPLVATSWSGTPAARRRPAAATK